MPAGDQQISPRFRPVSGFALAALVLGLLALVPWFLLAGIPAIICGHLALRNIRYMHRSGDVATGRLPAIMGLTLGYLATSLLSVLLVAWVSNSLFTPKQQYESARRSSCTDNLKQIGLACHLYSAYHAKAFPFSLALLHPEMISDLKGFTCPSTDTTPGDQDCIGAWADYVLIAGRTEADDPDALLAYCRPGNHGEDGTLVLLVNGHVEWVGKNRFEELITNTRDPARPDP